MTFLIVDDNSSMRRLIRGAVVKDNDIVYECSDGINALASYIQHVPDWVLMDIKMPELDGISATIQIKNAFPHARVVIISQYNDPEMQEDARQAGATEYVLKDDLLMVRDIIERT